MEANIENNESKQGRGDTQQAGEKSEDKQAGANGSEEAPNASHAGAKKSEDAPESSQQPGVKTGEDAVKPTQQAEANKSEYAHKSSQAEAKSEDAHKSPQAEAKSEDAHKSPQAEAKSEDAHKLPQVEANSEDAHKSSQAEATSEDAHKSPQAEDAHKSSQQAEAKSEDAQKSSQQAEAKSEDAHKSSQQAEAKREGAQRSSQQSEAKRSQSLQGETKKSAPKYASSIHQQTADGSKKESKKVTTPRLSGEKSADTLGRHQHYSAKLSPSLKKSHLQSLPPSGKSSVDFYADASTLRHYWGHPSTMDHFGEDYDYQTEHVDYLIEPYFEKHCQSPISPKTEYEADLLEDYMQFLIEPLMEAVTPFSAIASSVSCEEQELQRTIAIIKPDAMHYRDVILRAIKEAGFQIIAKRRLHLTAEQVSEIYAKYYGTPTFPQLVVSGSLGAVLVISMAAIGAVSKWKHMVEPDGALKSEWFHPLSVRTRFGLHKTQPHLLHASETLKESNRENRYFYPNNILEPLIHEEDKVVDFCSLYVNPTLSSGLLEVVKTKPRDPVMFLAEWLLVNNPYQPRLPYRIATTPT